MYEKKIEKLIQDYQKFTSNRINAIEGALLHVNHLLEFIEEYELSILTDTKDGKDEYWEVIKRGLNQELVKELKKKFYCQKRAVALKSSTCLIKTMRCSKQCESCKGEENDFDFYLKQNERIKELENS